MLFRLINQTQATHCVWSNGQQVGIQPKTTRTLDISENNAIFLKRSQLRGSRLLIESLNTEGEAILQNARASAAPEAVDPLIPEKTGPIIDEIEATRIAETAMKLNEVLTPPTTPEKPFTPPTYPKYQKRRHYNERRR